jgi:hypothetical protein
MSTLRLTQFSGEIPRLLPRLLPETGSQFAENIRLDDGGLTPVRGLRFEQALDPADDNTTIYKFGDTWLTWDTVVNAAPGPVATDRLYYTGDGVPKMRVGTDIYNLKVQYPTAALTATVGGTNEVQQIVVSATGGTFTVTFDGSTTTALAYNVSAASLQTALDALDTIEPGDVTVTGGPGATAALVITFGGRFAFENVPELATNSASLTGGSGTATVSTTAQGSGSGDVTTRLYVYTYVTAFGEESEPCPVSNDIEWQPGQTVTLSGFATATSGRNITKQRIYRLQSSIATGADLFFIAERSDTASNYVDSVASDDFSEVLPSSDWNQPPDTLKGLVSLPNGMMAAFVGKDLYFCEPYRPHAWPQKYVLTMDYNIVALGAYGTTIVVMTDGNPYIVVGTAPELMQQERMEINAPCINARGVVDLGYAVAYPTTDGLAIAANGVVQIATEGLMTRNNWLRTSPGSFAAGQYSGRYFASFEYLGADDVARSGTFIFDLTASTPFMLRASVKAEGMFYDIAESRLYMLIGSDIYEWDAIGEPNEIMIFRTKEFIAAAPVTYGCIFIESADAMSADEAAAIQAKIDEIAASNAVLFAGDSIGGELNGATFNEYTINGDALIAQPVGEYTSVSVFADGALVATVSEVDEVVRLPAAAKARRIEVEASGTRPLAQITLATSPRELNSV